jgi:hypothetical protein
MFPALAEIGAAIDTVESGSTAISSVFRVLRATEKFIKSLPYSML